jgi:hypothetical protein
MSDRAPIQFLLIEQDFVGRIKHGMTITDRRKADCWALGKQYGLHNQTGRATKPKVTLALEEVVWTKFANWPDTYEPTAGAVEVLGEAKITYLRQDAAATRAAALNG